MPELPGSVEFKEEDVIRPFDRPFGTDGSIAILKGNLAPDGAVVNTR